MKLKVTVRVYVSHCKDIYYAGDVKEYAGEPKEYPKTWKRIGKELYSSVISRTFMVNYPSRVTRMARPGSNDNHFFAFF